MLDGRLLQSLADGQFHSGASLGRVLGISRSAVWNHVRALEESGIVVHSVPGKGYRIPGGLDLLDRERIKAGLRPDVHLDIRLATTSTNDLASEWLRAGGVVPALFMAEQQTAGRGRRGRAWISPFASNLYLSVPREFPGGLAAIDGLSLAVGVMLCEALATLGVRGVGLKWPNDLLVGEKKLGGVLIEATGEVAGACAVVLGVGINIRMGASAAAAIDQPWTDLVAAGLSPGRRNEVAIAVGRGLLAGLDEFAAGGLAPFVARWSALDVLRDSDVAVVAGPVTTTGVARGIDARGALVVDTPDGRRIFHGGEVSLRRRP